MAAASPCIPPTHFGGDTKGEAAAIAPPREQSARSGRRRSLPGRRVLNLVLRLIERPSHRATSPPHREVESQTDDGADLGAGQFGVVAQQDQFVVVVR